MKSTNRNCYVILWCVIIACAICFKLWGQDGLQPQYSLAGGSVTSVTISNALGGEPLLQPHGDGQNVTIGKYENSFAVPNTNLDATGPSLIGGGSGNFISADSLWSVIMGGQLNVITNSAESFIGTCDNTTAGWGGYVNGGIYNSPTSFIGGGQQNSILDNSPYGFIGSSQTSVIGGQSQGCFIGSGDHLQIGMTNAGAWTVDAQGYHSASVATPSKTAFNQFSFIGGGENNIIVGGTNTSQKPYGFILGGYGNTLDGGYTGAIGWWLSNSVPGNILIGMTNNCMTVKSNGLVSLAKDLTIGNTVVANGVTWHFTNIVTPTFAYPNGSLCTTSDGGFWIRTNSTWVRH